MKRVLLSTVMFLTTVGGIRSDVVATPTSTDGNVIPASNSVGVSFTLPGSSAANGKWLLNSMKVNLFSDTASNNLTNASVYLYSVDTSANIATKLGQAGNVAGFGGAISTTTAATEFTLTWDQDNVFGSTTTQNGLSAGTYALIASLTTTANAKVVFGTLSGNAGWSLYDPSSTFPTYLGVDTLGASFDLVSTNSPDTMAIGVTGVAVPEPGTLLLGGIAAMGGAGGWWARRRKKAAPVTEEAAA